MVLPFVMISSRPGRKCLSLRLYARHRWTDLAFDQGLSVAWSESPALCLKMLQNQSWRCVNRQQFSSASFWLGGENRSGPEPVLQHMKTHTGLSLLAVLNPCAEGSTKGPRGYLRVVSSGGMVCPLCNIP